MPKLFINFFVLILVFVFALSVFNIADRAEAQEEQCDPATVKVIARNDTGNFLPNIGFEIYETAYDADNNPKPGRRVASGRTGEILGYQEVSFVPEAGSYTVKMWDQNSNVGSFWFFDDFSVGCGQDYELTEYLSGINFVLRDADGNLRKNTNISLYTQRYDADGEPIKERQDLVKTLNTSNEGEVTIYVADASHFLFDEDGGSYVFVTTGEDGGEFVYYDLTLSDGSTEIVDYVFSDIEFHIEDEEGTPFPANTKIEIYEQVENYDLERDLGEHIKDVYTDDQGMAFFEYPKGLYAARIKKSNDEYQYFWDLDMIDQERNRIDLTVEGDWSGTEGACEADSGLEVVARNLDGEYIPDIHFELYEELSDVDGSAQVGERLVSGQVNDLGRGTVNFNPDPRKKYVLKMYDRNPEAGAFWFFDDIRFSCDEDKSIAKDLSSIKVILRNADRSLKKNQSFSIYTQKSDVDGGPIQQKDDLLANLNTGQEGFVRLYLSGPEESHPSENGKYIFSSQGENRVEFTVYDIEIDSAEDYNFDYAFSDIVLNIKNAAGEALANFPLEIYKQKSGVDGASVLGDLVTTQKSNEEGIASYEYPKGTYAVRFKDDRGEYFTYWDIRIRDGQRTYKNFIRSTARISLRNNSGVIMPEGTGVNIYSTIAEEGSDYYYKNKKIDGARIGPGGYADISLVPGVYLFSFVDGKEYGLVTEMHDSRLHKIDIRKLPENQVRKASRFRIIQTVTEGPVSSSLSDKMAGRILLQVEENGEAWYVDGDSKRRYYMRDGEVAYQMMREFGLGISNADLDKIPVGINREFEEMDYDGDYVFDKMEEALGTDMYARDSDGDGYSDDEELENGYNPLGDGKQNLDLALAEKLKGKILLQVESRGEAWYVNPEDGRRYYMPDGDSAYQIMRYLSLGITNENLSKIEEGIINNY